MSLCVSPLLPEPAGTTSAKGKKSRRRAPKSRRGCQTCKIRHKKCDESKPACLQCIETDRVCDFLQVPQSDCATARNRQISTLQIHSQPNYALTTSTLASVDAQDLDYFRKVCSQDFAGFFGNGVWDQLVLQHTVTEDSIRFAAMAVGAMHRSFAFAPYDAAIKNMTRRHAFSTYAKAISALNSTFKATMGNIELACVASLLFMTLETFVSDDSSMLHLEAGFKILRIASTTKDQNYPFTNNIDKLVSTFSRMDIHAATFANCYNAKALAIPAVPAIYSSLLQAREILDAILARMHFYLTPHEQTYRYALYTFPPASVTPYVDEIKTLLRVWNLRFEAFIMSQSLKLTRRDEAAANILRISYQSTKIFIETCLNINQTSYDAYLPSFTKIVELSKAVVEFTVATQTHSGRRIAFDIGVIQPLQFVARKCRDRALRRLAIDVANIAGREGVWDGHSIAQVLRWVVAKEEENLSPTEEEVMLGFAIFGDEIPEERDRLHGVGIDFDRRGRRCVIRTARRRYDYDSEEGWEFLEGNVAWGAQQGEGEEGIALVSAFLR